MLAFKLTVIMECNTQPDRNKKKKILYSKNLYKQNNVLGCSTFFKIFSHDNGKKRVTIIVNNNHIESIICIQI